MSIAHIYSGLSVRARIIALGVIPVIGLLAIGTAFMAGDNEVESAFDSVHRDTAVADASRDLKAGLLIMRAATTQFVAHPSADQVKNFARGQELALHCLDRIETALAASGQNAIAPLRATVQDLKVRFAELVHEQKALGFDETEGRDRPEPSCA